MEILKLSAADIETVWECAGEEYGRTKDQGRLDALNRIQEACDKALEAYK